MKVVFHYDASASLREQVEGFCIQGLEVVCCPAGSEQAFFTELVDAEVIWHVLQPITAGVLARAPHLRLIQKIGVGVNTIDLEAAKSRGIAVCNMPGTNSRAVAEMTLLLMLAALRKATHLSRVCRSGLWQVDNKVKETLGELGGRTVGLVGFGEIPKILAPILTAMGARVVYTARSPKSGPCAVPYDYLPLQALLAQSDIVSLHIPLTPDSVNLFDAPCLALMKPGAVLINTARGELVDEAALYDALVSGSLGAAGLDVFSPEPVLADNPLLALENVVATPHVAWLTNETLSRSLGIAVQNSLAVLRGEALLHRVA